MQANKKLKKLESLERKYLNKYFHFLKFAEEELLEGFQTKYRIQDDWKHQWDPEQDGKGISDFAAGAERIIYSLLNGKGIGQPISAPIEFNAITISLFSEVGYSQSDVNEIIKNLVLLFSNALDKFPLNCFVKSK